ncbi:hypothetical protein [Streptomyces sp. NPDC090025]|uniref:hypothetical protein n=1 Tax=Streptomyces sp. NPDC090025 TaxID=3365922 RepID=UPI0038346982
MGDRSRKWLRVLWRDAQVGLTALGQGFGLYTVPECYGYLPVYGGGAPDPRVAPDPWRAAGPRPGHPERLVDAGAEGGMSAEEAVLWAQLAEVWDGADPSFRTPPRPPRPRPRHE